MYCWKIWHARATKSLVEKGRPPAPRELLVGRLALSLHAQLATEGKVVPLPHAAPCHTINVILYAHACMQHVCNKLLLDCDYMNESNMQSYLDWSDMHTHLYMCDNR
jgi:hypothetical protein